MTLGISKLWGGGKDQDTADVDSPLTEHVDSHFIATTMAKTLMEHHQKATISGRDEAYLDAIAKFLSVINDQEGITATVRDFDFLDSNKKQMGLAIDISAKGLNRKIKEFGFVLELKSEDKKDIEVTLLRFNKEVGFGEFVGANFDKSWKVCSLNDPQGRADILEHIALRIAGEKLHQRFKDRAKGYIIQRSGAYDRLEKIRTGKVNPRKPF